jgi:hypothetical protein
MKRPLLAIGLCVYLASTWGCGGGGGGSGPTQAGGINVSDAEQTNTNTGSGQTEDNTQVGSQPTEPSVLQGQFIDSAVAGLGYRSESVSGVTEIDGGFDCQEGQKVEFAIGDISIGEGDCVSILTPVELVPGAQDETNPIVTNIIRFLQTLDDDGDPANGITITSQVTALTAGRAIDFEQGIEAFEDDGGVQTAIAELTAVTRAGARMLVPFRQAQDQFRAALLSLRAGAYNGEIDGDVSGTFEATIDTGGNVSDVVVQDTCTDQDSDSGSGSSSSSSSCSSSVSTPGSGSVATSGSGTVASSGGFTAEVAVGNDTYVFTGSVDKNGTMSGSWQAEFSGRIGIFEGRRQ